MADKKRRTRIPQLTKVRAELQKEILSTCPFCNNEDVGHFEIHHIDDDRANNLFENLFLLCRICHSKVTKGDIPQDEVIRKKQTFPLSHSLIECASIKVDRKNCAWEPFGNAPNTFRDNETNKSPFPILTFSMINHSPRTVLLKEIWLQAKHLPQGLSGIPRPRILKSIAKFKILLPGTDETTKFQLTDEIEVPPSQAFKFQIQIFSQWQEDIYPIEGRKALYFSFQFNNGISFIAPTIFLNCKSENEKMIIRLLH